MREGLVARGERVGVGPPGVADIAGELGMGVSRFAKAFRAATGVPPHAYAMRLRVRVACELLRTTRMPIARVAERAGFASQSHLTEHCRRFAGATPAVIRAGSSAGSRAGSRAGSQAGSWAEPSNASGS
ncbi:MAG: helix-turn-helix transcriptional regulator [Planctomycetota bacterium]